MKHFKLNYFIVFGLIVIWCIQPIFGFSQIQTKTNFKNFEKMESFPTGWDITLNGKVKSITIITHSPDYSCDTIKTIYNKAYFENTKCGYTYGIDCIIDSISYFFNPDLQICKIISKNLFIFFQNYEDRSQSEVFFVHGLIQYKINTDNGVISNETSYEYDTNNQIIKITSLYNKHSNINFHLFEYNNKNLLIKKEEYTFHELYEKSPKLYNREEFVYDSLSNLIEKIWGKDRIDYFKYDTLGNKIEEGYAQKSTDGKSYYHPTEVFEYDNNNKLSKEYHITYSKKHDRETFYWYDEMGRKTEIKEFSINKKDTVLKNHLIYKYDEKGNIIEVESFFDQICIENESELFKKKTISYDIYGNITEEIYYSGFYFDIKILKYIYIYDSYGNWIKREMYQGEKQDNLERKEIIDRIIEYY